MTAEENDRAWAQARRQVSVGYDLRYVTAQSSWPPATMAQTTMQRPATDDGSAANEPTPESWRAHIHGLTSRNEELSRELRMVRGLLSRVEDGAGDATAPPDNSPEGVKRSVERTIEHLLGGHTTKDQRKGLATATERADRVKAGSDAAVGRALKLSV